MIDLCLTLPSSSAQAERGFSAMKRTKTDLRPRMLTKTLNTCMAVNLLTPEVKQYDPQPAIIHWLNAAKAPRRPFLMEGKSKGPAFEKVKLAVAREGETQKEDQMDQQEDEEIHESEENHNSDDDQYVDENVVHGAGNDVVQVEAAGNDVAVVQGAGNDVHQVHGSAISDDELDEGFDDCYLSDDEDNEMNEQDIEEWFGKEMVVQD